MPDTGTVGDMDDLNDIAVDLDSLEANIMAALWDSIARVLRTWLLCLN